MRRFILSLVFVFVALCSFPQIYLEGKNIDQIVNTNYILIHMVNPFSRTYAIYHLPKNTVILKTKRLYVTDEEGKPMVFNTFAEVIDFFEQNGWVYREIVYQFKGSFEGFSEPSIYVLFQRAEAKLDEDNGL